MPAPNQLGVQARRRARHAATTCSACPTGTRTEAGLRHNVRVGVQYLEAWLRGNGCVPLYNLMEDAATAEISRAQVWQWLHHKRRRSTASRSRRSASPASSTRRCSASAARSATRASTGGRFPEARELFVRLSTAPELRRLPHAARVRPARIDASRETAHARPTKLQETAPCPLPLRSRRRPTERLARQALRRHRAPVRQGRRRAAARLGTHRAHARASSARERLWELLHTEPFVAALGALTGNQAVQMVRAGLKAIYLSGWQVAADANTAGQMYPDQSLYPANSVPGGGAAHQRGARSAPTRSSTPRARPSDALVRPDRRRRRGRLRRARSTPSS